MLVFLLASTLLHICSGQSLVTDLKISEHGADYKQRVEYDPSTKAVTFQVPKHHDILDSTVIIHKPLVSSQEASELLFKPDTNLGYHGGICPGEKYL